MPSKVPTPAANVSLQVVVATHGSDGLARTALMCLPQVPRVSWLIECQSPGGAPLAIPQSLLRSDIEVIFNNTTGLSANRNMMLRHATAPYVMIADDDLRFSIRGLQQLVDTMDAHPHISLFCFRHDGAVARRYPKGTRKLRAYALRRHYPYSLEIALRVADVRARGLWFSELAGIGAPVLCAGEEDLFVFHLLRSGLRGCFFPFTVATHAGPTTNDYNDSDAMWRTRGAVLSVLHPVTWFLRALRHIRHLPLMLQGAGYARRNRL